ncbi:hypothetical protein M9Y10_000267 [Tritrichomonas musculus]|uniref:Uncharacterized protein n=1 Tax=Tritrichomonas musculus TaxID=1915356 RepID=A0ABR2L3S4_9EUKA
MYNLIVKLRNRLESNGIQIPEEEKIEFNIQKPKSNIKGRIIEESASYTAAFNDHSIGIDDDNSSVHSQTTRKKTNGKQSEKARNSKQIQGQQSLTDTSSNNNNINEISTSSVNN